MALTDLEKTYLYNYSQQLLQQDMLTNQLFGASKVGQNLRSLVLGEPVRAQTFTNPFEEAISGKLRGDAGAIRQAAKNVGEAASMMGIAQEAMSTITDSLREMEEIAEKVKSGEYDGTAASVQSDYNQLRDKIISIYENTDFNGIYMLDSGKWDTDQIDSSGNVYIQSSKDGGFNITFHAVDDATSSYDWTDLDGADLAAAGTTDTQLQILDNLKTEMDIIQDLYDSKVSTLQSQQVSLEGQAQLLDQAAQLRKPSDPNYSLEKLLADLVAQQVGTIVDSSG